MHSRPDDLFLQLQRCFLLTSEQWPLAALAMTWPLAAEFGVRRTSMTSLLRVMVDTQRRGALGLLCGLVSASCSQRQSRAADRPHPACPPSATRCVEVSTPTLETSDAAGALTPITILQVHSRAPPPVWTLASTPMAAPLVDSTGKLVAQIYGTEERRIRLARLTLRVSARDTLEGAPDDDGLARIRAGTGARTMRARALRYRQVSEGACGGGCAPAARFL